MGEKMILPYSFRITDYFDVVVDASYCAKCGKQGDKWKYTCFIRRNICFTAENDDCSGNYYAKCDEHRGIYGGFLFLWVLEEKYCNEIKYSRKNRRYPQDCDAFYRDCDAACAAEISKTKPCHKSCGDEKE